MPELPEVEIAARNLRAWLVGERIERAIVHEPRSLGGRSVRGFRSRVRGQTILGVDRVGKRMWMVTEAGDGIGVHLGMSGKLLKRGLGDPPPRHTRVTWQTDEVAVHVVAMRIFGRVAAAKLPMLRRWIGVDALGPDALELCAPGSDPNLLAARFVRTKKALKVALMDQERLAGLGNIHAAEALFFARVSPDARSASLDRRDWKRLQAGIYKTLADTLERDMAEEVVYLTDAGGATNHFSVYAREGEPCRRCKAPINKAKHAGRSTFYCPKCQR